MIAVKQLGRFAGQCLLVGAALGSAPAVQAQGGPDDWKFSAAIYGWFPSIKGDTNFPTGGSGPPIHITTDSVIDSLKFAFMGTIEGQTGKWGFLADWVYADLGAERTTTHNFTIGGLQIPASATGDFSLDVKTNILTLAGTYSAIAAPDHVMNVVFGARMLDLDQTLDYSITGNLGPIVLPNRTGSVDASLTNWDAIVGVKGRVRFGDGMRWFVPYYGDIGTGNSKFTWQALLGLGYSFQWGDVVAAWRYLDYEFKSGEPLETFTLNGALIGVAFRW